MFGWLRSIISGRLPGQNPSSRNVVEVEALDGVAKRKLVLDDAKHIEAALAALTNVGLELTQTAKHSLPTTAKEIAEQWEGIFFSKEPTPGDWALVALSRELGAYKNAAFFQDHCFDVAELEDYSEMISDIVALAGDEWTFEGVEVKNARRPDAAIEWRQPVTVSIKAKPEAPPFELTHAKDFDWSLVFRLNERLPKGVEGRFAIFLDGNATIVFLTPEKIQQLNSLCGYEFFYEEGPEEQDAQS